MNQLDLDLALERFEAELAPELAAHATAHYARALVDPTPQAPPWPALLLDGRAGRLACVALHLGDPELRRRADTLARWAAAAALSADPAWQNACTAERDLPGLGARHRALAAIARRRGVASPRALVDAIHGPVETEAMSAKPAELGSSAGRVAGPIPTWRSVLARLAEQHGLDTAGLVAQPGACALTIAISPGQVRCVLGPGGGDPLDALIVATHELGHGLYAAQQGGLSLGLAAPPSRWFDEAVAAWAVRTLEDDPALAPAARARRLAREALTERLAALETSLFAGASVETSWDRWVPNIALAAVPALFDEPGVMASYHAADRCGLAPLPGQLRGWARGGARRRG